ncbi:phage tail tape measure protein [Bradyrhizobium diazoefficiens]|uniref:Bacteriophage tail tape measure C-terminal domain-containing protein n=1 Tax=Bradyrhizobium diazoefficiens TaxID=1355477 RepID=A0A809YJG6_9BRAD|nr:phage tail tape measure protein [Bradyrhizobium diazoefficiens]BCA04203.1 hypothetical protein H12S4_51070 [Bradyrhizobium diazoefficiens]BCA21560.1 hypothetical protein BDHH15_47750 [Bradyrhizobium diazoefficiens]BCE39729.1 hypothetical protein XF3B_47600 [Bradyrhizobium diazoefficiens]BCF53125.1 hypothetical protein XF17B_47630 [Bradyrhizobium diazoefficiens]
MSQVVTELVIDSDTSGADRFSQAMDQAGSSASSAQASAAQMTLAIAGVGIAVAGAIAGLRSFVNYVGEQTQQLVDLSDGAERAGMSVKEFQQTLYAARAAGLSDKDFFSGIDKIGTDLAQASQKVTEFGELFKQNGLSIRQQNGELITTKQALTEIMGLMQSASPQVSQRITEIAGVSRSWIPFLREGAEQFEAMKQKAADLGIIINDDTIAKAREFNSEWKAAVAGWDLQFKASLADLLPLLVKLAEYSVKALDAIGGIYGFFSRLVTPVDQQTVSQLNDTVNQVYGLVEVMQRLGDQSFRAKNLKGALGLPEEADLAQVMNYLDQIQKRYDGLANAPQRIRVTPDYSTVLPNMAGKSDIDKVTDAVERQIAKLQADAEAAGQGAGELERLRVEAQLYAAAERAGVTDTEKFAERFYDLAARAGQAADALAKAKVAAELKFGGNTAFLSDSDVQIAARLKDIYPDVATALNSAEAAQMRFNSSARSLSSAIENDLVSGLTDIATGAKTAGQGFQDMATSIVKAIEQMIIKIAIVEPLMRSFQSAFSGLGLSGGTGAPLNILPSATGNVFASGEVVPFALGGVPDLVSSPTIAPMALFGEAGEEAIMPLRRGADGRLGVAAAGGAAAPQVNVTLIESPNAQGSVTRQPNNSGGIDIEVAIAQINAKSLATPGGVNNRVMTDQFGLRQSVARR